MTMLRVGAARDGISGVAGALMDAYLTPGSGSSDRHGNGDGTDRAGAFPRCNDNPFSQIDQPPRQLDLPGWGWPRNIPPPEKAYHSCGPSSHTRPVTANRAGTRKEGT